MEGTERDRFAVPPNRRIPVLDTLRGFALFGVLIVNLFTVYDWIGKPAGILDQSVQVCVKLFFEDKAWPLLSLLFGLGFTIQIERARARCTGIFWIHLRRMLVLYVFGILGISLFAANPILIRYAAVGLLLLLFAWLPPSKILISVFVFFVVSAFDGPMYMKYQQRNHSERTERPSAQPQQQPSLTEAILGDFKRSPGMVFKVEFWPGRQTEIFTMFLVGLYIGKRKLYLGLDQHRDLLWRTLKRAGLVGMAGTIVAVAWMVMSPNLALHIAHRFIELGSGDLQSLGYAAALSLLVLQAPSSSGARLLACYGRMPLTNFLTQWLLMRLLFDGLFVGLGGKIGPTTGALIAVAIFSLQLGWSWWWLSRNQFGPAEWAWKTLTYLRIQPMRFQSAAGGESVPETASA